MNSLLLTLTVLASDDEFKGITRVMKTVFLVQEEVEGPTCYEFESGDYGPFSHQLYHDIQTLNEEGFINMRDEDSSYPDGSDVTYYEIEDKGMLAVHAMHDENEYVEEEVAECVRGYGTAGLWDIFDYIARYYGAYMSEARIAPNPGKAMSFKSWQ